VFKSRLTSRNLVFLLKDSMFKIALAQWNMLRFERQHLDPCVY
jgi:hypothetical protein